MKYEKYFIIHISYFIFNQYLRVISLSQLKNERLMAMFNTTSDKKQTTSTGATTANINTEGLTCIIAKGTVIEGKITSTENMRIDGTIKGQVLCDKRLVMDAEGVIEGDVQAGESTIKGRVIGTVSVINTLHLLESSFIKGDIKAKKLHVEEGAKYDGKCLIG
jgi:cytoskeletal protein CcmA (bactofilin family)